MSTTLAKLSPPSTRGCIARARLHGLLDDASASGAVWLAGEPGAGKSTLAATWCATRPARAFWYRVDSDDCDPATVFRYLSLLLPASVRRRLPTFDFSDFRQVAAFAKRFFRAFYAALPPNACVVIDDVQKATDDTFGALIAAALEERPVQIALLFIARHEPEAAMLEHIAHRRLISMPSACLAFTFDEARQMVDRRVPLAAIERAVRETGGWAAGLSLLAGPDGESRGGYQAEHRHQALADFVVERTLGNFSAKDLEVAFAASLLPDIDEQACSILGLDADAVARLQALHHQHAFVIRLDRRPVCWRVHDLLRTAIKGRQETISSPEWRADMQHRAAGLARDRGLLGDAVALYHAANEDGEALATIVSFANRYLREQRLTELSTALISLPEALLGRNAAAQELLGEIAFSMGSPETVKHYSRAHVLYMEGGDPQRALVVAAREVAFIVRGVDDYSPLGDAGPRFENGMSHFSTLTDPVDRLRVGVARLGLCTVQESWSEHSTSCRQMHSEICAILEVAFDALSANEALTASAALLASAGENDDAVSFERAVIAAQPWLKAPDLSEPALAHWLVAYGARAPRFPMRGAGPVDLDPEACLERAVALAEKHGRSADQFEASLYLVHSAIAVGDVALAGARMRMLRVAADARRPAQMASVLQLDARIATLRGDWQTALDINQQVLLLEEQQAAPLAVVWGPRALRAQILVGLSRYDEARQSLNDLALPHTGAFAESSAVLMAVCEFAASNDMDPGARDDLAVKAIKLARAADWPYFAPALRAVASELCARVLKLGVEIEFACRAISARRLEPPSRFCVEWPWPIRVKALGGFSVHFPDRRQIGLGPRAQRKPLDLLKLLVAHSPDGIDVAVALDALWTDAEGGAARSAFDMAVHRLRKLLGQDDALLLDGGRLSLNPRHVWADVWAFASGDLQDYAGPLFGSAEVPAWCLASRNKLHRLFLRRAEERGLELEAAQRYSDALSVYELGLAQDGLAETLYQGAIRCHVKLGRAADAMRIFRRCREQLSIVLGIPPAYATQCLVDELIGRGV